MGCRQAKLHCMCTRKKSMDVNLEVPQKFVFGPTLWIILDNERKSGSLCRRYSSLRKSRTPRSITIYNKQDRKMNEENDLTQIPDV